MNDLTEDLHLFLRQLDEEIKSFTPVFEGDEQYVEGLRNAKEQLMDLITRYE